MISLLVLRERPTIIPQMPPILPPGLPPTEPPPAPPADASIAERAIAMGMARVGSGPYQLGAACGRMTFDCQGPFDCSSFVNWCFHHAGMTWNLPQTGLLAGKLPRIPNGQQQRGDIMVMALGGNWSSVEGAHAGIWLGDGNLLQCGILHNGVGIWAPVSGWPFVFVRGV